MKKSECIALPSSNVIVDLSFFCWPFHGIAHDVRNAHALDTIHILIINISVRVPVRVVQRLDKVRSIRGTLNAEEDRVANFCPVIVYYASTTRIQRIS